MYSSKSVANIDTFIILSYGKTSKSNEIYFSTHTHKVCVFIHISKSVYSTLQFKISGIIIVNLVYLYFWHLVVTRTADTITIRNGTTRTEYAITITKTYYTAHFSKNFFFHKCKYRGYFICVHTRIQSISKPLSYQPIWIHTKTQTDNQSGLYHNYLCIWKQCVPSK